MYISKSEPQPLSGLAEIVGALRAAGESSRLRALALLAHGELSVGELAQVLGQSQPRVSRHMRLLTESGLADRAPEGAWVFYRLAREGAPGRALVDRLIEALDPADPELAKDRERLTEIRAARADAAEAYFARNAEAWDQVRALHLPEADIGQAVREAIGEGPFDLLIDVGVGAGWMLTQLADRVRRAEGFDPNRRMLTVARANLDHLPQAQGRFGVRLGDVYEPPYPSGSADLVTVHQVLHYLPDPGRAVERAAQLLKPGGRLVIVDFAPHSQEFLREHHAHRRLGFADEEIARWCAAAGAPITKTTALAPKNDAKDALTVKIWVGDKIEQQQ
jgi:ubiquinone/menaquinone biosynthesis C-methylase UbiE/DNA-binding transcriptional ArsR family regulator